MRRAPHRSAFGSHSKDARAWTRAGAVRRRLGVLSRVGAIVLASCGGDDGGLSVSEQRGTVGDAGVTSDAGSLDAALGTRVTNVGAACSLLAPMCQGAGAQCLEISLSGAFYAGGYCTSDCRSSSECGDDGECPVGESERVQPSYGFRSTWARKCFKSCVPGTANACRFGYACMSLAEAYDAPDAPAPLQRNVCIPRAPSYDDDRRRDAGAP